MPAGGALAEIIIGSILVGGAVGAGAEALTNKPKNPSATAPNTPDQSSANVNAAATVSSARAELLRTGGQTDETGGLGILTGSDVSTSSLVGG